MSVYTKVCCEFDTSSLLFTAPGDLDLTGLQLQISTDSAECELPLRESTPLFTAQSESKCARYLGSMREMWGCADICSHPPVGSTYCLNLRF